MRAITKTEIKTALDEVGITNGQTIMVHSDLTRIGWVDNAKSRVDILEFYFKSIINQPNLQYLFIETRTTDDELFGIGKKIGKNEYFSDHYSCLLYTSPSPRDS